MDTVDKIESKCKELQHNISELSLEILELQIVKDYMKEDLANQQDILRQLLEKEQSTEAIEETTSERVTEENPQEQDKEGKQE